MTKKKTQTKIKCFKDSTYAVFSESRGFKDFKYDIELGTPQPQLSFVQSCVLSSAVLSLVFPSSFSLSWKILSSSTGAP